MITICVFSVTFALSIQYMAKKIVRYQAKLLNHRGDLYHFAVLGLVAILLLGVAKIDKLSNRVGDGPPSVKFAPLMTGSSLTSFATKNNNVGLQHSYVSFNASSGTF